MTKRFKAIICVLLVLIFALGCASCSGGANAKPKDTKSAETEKETAEIPATGAKTEAPETEPATAEAPEKKEARQGEIDLLKNTYKSETLGIGLKLSDEWTIQSPEDLAALVGQTSVGESLKYAAVTYDFYALKASSGSSVTVIFENMKKNYGRTYDEDEYLELAQVSVKSALESQGATVSKIETVTRSIDGKTFKGFYIELKMGGVDVYEYSLIKRCGDHLANISIGARTVEKLDAVLASFYAL